MSACATAQVSTASNLCKMGKITKLLLAVTSFQAQITGAACDDRAWLIERMAEIDSAIASISPSEKEYRPYRLNGRIVASNGVICEPVELLGHLVSGTLHLRATRIPERGNIKVLDVPGGVVLEYSGREGCNFTVTAGAPNHFEFPFDHSNGFPFRYDLADAKEQKPIEKTGDNFEMALHARTRTGCVEARFVVRSSENFAEFQVHYVRNYEELFSAAGKGKFAFELGRPNCIIRIDLAFPEAAK